MFSMLHRCDANPRLEGSFHSEVSVGQTKVGRARSPVGERLRSLDGRAERVQPTPVGHDRLLVI